MLKNDINEVILEISVNTLYLKPIGSPEPPTYSPEYKGLSLAFTLVIAADIMVMTEPLTKGNHTVHFKSSLICSDPDCSDPNYVQDLKYNIIAQ